MSLRDQLEAIRGQYGELTPRLVVDTAKDPKHPLHSRFDWNNKTAGEKYRLLQAGELIRKVRLTYKLSEDSEYKSIRAYHSVPTDEGHSYRTAEEIVEDPFLLKLHLQVMEREWRALRAKYDRFEEFAAMILRDLGEPAA